MGDKCGKFIFKKPDFLDFGTTWTLALLPCHLNSVNTDIGINRIR